MHARPTEILGCAYNLTNCPAFDGNGQDVTLNGPYVIEEYQPIEPSAYAWTAYYLVSRAGKIGNMDDVDVYSVDPDDLYAHSTEIPA